MDKERQTPRGIRNNNPGNLRWGIGWIGLVPKEKRTDPDFCQFEDAFHGIRALALNLADYKKLHQIHTLRAAIYRWAPSDENNTAAYLKSVSEQTKLAPDADIDLADWLTLHDVTRAIIRQENGPGPFANGRWYPTDTIGRAISDALGCPQ